MPNANHSQHRHFTADQWRLLFQRSDANGTSVAAFCRGESISASSFYRWRQKLAGPSAEPAETPLAARAFIDAGASADEQPSAAAP